MRGVCSRCDGYRGQHYTCYHRQCLEPVLSIPWILDIDVTVKPLYGHQQGAQIGHNPQKTGRAIQGGLAIAPLPPSETRLRARRQSFFERMRGRIGRKWQLLNGQILPRIHRYCDLFIDDQAPPLN